MKKPILRVGRGERRPKESMTGFSDAFVPIMPALCEKIEDTLLFCLRFSLKDYIIEA